MLALHMHPIKPRPHLCKVSQRLDQGMLSHPNLYLFSHFHFHSLTNLSIGGGAATTPPLLALQQSCDELFFFFFFSFFIPNKITIVA